MTDFEGRRVDRPATRVAGLARGRWLVAALLALPLAFLLLFYFYPLIAIARTSLRAQADRALGALLERVLSPVMGRVISFTFGQALLSTVLTLAIGVPGAFIFARYDFPGKRLLQALVTVPFVLPTVVVAAAFNTLLGPGSWASRWLGQDLRYTLWAILIAHVFYNYAVVVRMVRGFWSTLDPHLEEAARTLGASPARIFLEVTLPLLWPVVLTAGILIFIFCFTSFGVVLILGGPRFATLEVEIYRQTINFANLPLAAALSLVQILFTLVMMLLYTRLQQQVARPLDLKPRWATTRRPASRVEAALLIVNLLVMVGLLATPLVALLVRSLGSGLRYYAALFENARRGVFYVPPVAAVGNSVRVALMTTGLAVVLGLLTSLALLRQRGGWLVDALFMLPLGTSAVTLGLGYLLSMDRPPLDLRGTVLLIVLAHTLVALPFVIRSLLPAFQSIRPELREAAALLGAAPLRVMGEVDLPIAWRALIVGAIFAFTISMGEFGATSMIARPELPTIPVAIYRFLSRPGSMNYGQALAMSTILMAVCVVGFVAIERLRPPGVQPF